MCAICRSWTALTIDCHAVMRRKRVFASGGCGPRSTPRHPPPLAALRATAEATAEAEAEAADVGSGGRPWGMRHAVLLFACMLLLWWSVRCAARGVAIVMSDFGGAQKPMKSGLNSQQMHARTGPSPEVASEEIL